MSKRILLLFGILVLAVISFSSQTNIVDVQKQIAERFERFLSKSVEEKLYVQLDKPYYSVGDSIWFNGFLINAALQKPISLSKFIYAELVNRDDSVVCRVKVSKREGSFAGYLKLTPALPSDFYTFRAYSNWMLNNSTDFLYQKSVFIGNSIDDRVKCDASFEKPVNGQLPVELSFYNKNGEPIAGKQFLIQSELPDFKKKKLWVKTDSDGKVFLYAPYDSLDLRHNVIDVLTNQEDIHFKTRLRLPIYNSDIDVQFFPESGVFLDNCKQVVAFKAIGFDGLSVDVTGRVYSFGNVEIASFKSANKGMGRFILNTKPGEKYYAVVKSANGIEKRFDLPPTQSEGISIYLKPERDRIMFKLNKQLKRDLGQLYLLVHSNAVIYLFEPITSDVGRISRSIFHAGLFSFAVIDAEGNTLCERLFFENNKKLLLITMSKNKDSFREREPVELTFSFRSADGKPLIGNYSVSVTDNNLVKQDSLSDNILSYLLLSSDIKGYIEEPASYFTENEKQGRENLDLLMLTQGWRRYKTSDITKGEFSVPGNYMEVGQTLSGKVNNALGKPSANCDVYAISNNFFVKTKTDNAGCYLFSGIEFEDSTTIIIKARKNKSIIDVVLVPDTMDFPTPETIIVNHRAKQKLDPPKEFFDQSRQKFFEEGGMRTINIEEVTVQAPRVEKEAKFYYSGFASSEITSEELCKTKITNIYNLLSTIPGVLVAEKRISFGISAGPPLIILDGVPVQHEIDRDVCLPSFIEYLPFNEIEKIEIFKGANAAIFGMRGGGGVIAFTLKKGVSSAKLASLSMVKYEPLGIQKPEQFYIPKYDIQSILEDTKPDFRTTIYWNPSLSSDSTGIAKVRFYTADQLNNYSVVLEGVSNEGEICRYVGQIELR